MIGVALSPQYPKQSVIEALGARKILWIDTVNQLLESISVHRIDRLLLDPVWMEESIWWTPVLQALAISGVSWSVLVDTANALQVWDLSPDPKSLSPAVWPLCVRVGAAGQLWHQGRPIQVTSRQRALLAVIAVDAEQTISAESVNRILTLCGAAPISGQALRVQLHQIRKVLGPGHLVTVRRRGYRWVNCDLPRAVPPAPPSGSWAGPLPARSVGEPAEETPNPGSGAGGDM